MLTQATSFGSLAVLPFGFFVELDAYPIEGLVRADAMTDQRYTFIERERALKGLPTVDSVLNGAKTARHPFSGVDNA